MNAEHEFYKSVIEANLCDKEALRARAMGAGQRQRIPRLRLGYAVAACAVLLASLTFAIPSARAAVLAWFDRAFRIEKYIQTPAEERTPIPQIDAAIVPQVENALAVTLVSAEPEWQSWAQGLTFRFEEALYDGETVYLSGVLLGDISPFMAAQYPDAGDVFFESGVLVTLDGRTLDASGIFTLAELDPGYQNADYTLTPQGQAYIRDAAQRFTIGFMEEGLDGTVEVALDMVFGPMEMVSQTEESTTRAMRPAVRFHVAGVELDASAGQAARATVEVSASAPLSGSVSVDSILIPDGDTAQVGNELLSLDGGTLEILKVNRRLSGLDLLLRLTPPPDWTDWQRQCFYKRLYFQLTVNGDPAGGFGETYSGIRGPICREDDWSSAEFQLSDISILERDWPDIGTLGVVLEVAELQSYNGVAIPKDGQASAPYEKDGWSEDAPLRLMEQNAVEAAIKE